MNVVNRRDFMKGIGCWPGVARAGLACEIPVCSIDLFPTVCEAVGAKLLRSKTA